MVNEYELMLVLSPKAVVSDEKKINELVKAQLTQGGKVVSTVSVGKKQLAYPLKGQTEGNFWLVTLSDSEKDIKGLTHTLQLSTDVLRHLLIKKE